MPETTKGVARKAFRRNTGRETRRSRETHPGERSETTIGLRLRRFGWNVCWRERRADVAALGCIALFFVLFFPQAVFGGRFLIAGDAYFYSYPLRTVAWEMVRAGQLPLWTPHVLSGYPLLAQAQLAIGYPLTWGYLFLPGHWAEQVYVLAPFLLSPMFTYAYARELGRSRLAALLAGLSFGYGGMMCSGISNSGMLTNSMLWLPLVLIPIDRVRAGGRGRFIPCLVAASAAYTMSVLNGHGQSFVYAGMLALAYSLFLSLVNVRDSVRDPVRHSVHDAASGETRREVAGDAGQPVEDETRRAYDEVTHVDDKARRGDVETRRGWFEFERWRPLLVAVGALGLAACVAAFQILETMAAARHSTRSALSYQTLGEGSFRWRQALASFVMPFYYFVDVDTYMPPLVLVLACVACAAAWRVRKKTDARIFFWLGVAVVSWVLMLGINTPFQRVVFYLPFLNQFRVPSRHAFEWTFALAVLAAYGWDALVAKIAARRTRAAPPAREIVFALLALALAVSVALLWQRAAIAPAPAGAKHYYTNLAESSYLVWKACFVLLVCAALWCGLRMAASRWRGLILVSSIMLTCYGEKYAIISCWWGGNVSYAAARFSAISPITRYLKTLPPEENRVYTRVDLFAEDFTLTPRFEGANLTALHGLHNVAGIEPLIFDRYSRALGGVGADSVTPRAGFPPNGDLFQGKSHVLDLLNATHVVSYANLATSFVRTVSTDGIGFASSDANLNLLPGQTVRFAGGTDAGDTLALVTVLSNSIELKQGTVVAKVRLELPGGAVVERELRAGVDTAEWAHERPDVRAIIQHALAPVFDSRAGDEGHSFDAYRYLARVPLGLRARVEKIEITNVTRSVPLNLLKATLHDSASNNSTPLTLASFEGWEPIYQKENALLLRNLRAQPRAWLVGEAEAVDGEEALRRIRGQSEKEFDPRRTALMEVRPDELPALSGGELPAGATARIVSYEPARLVIETDAQRAAVLVLSEINYPGWEATVDGAAARIDTTNYLLRGVVVPAGAHRVEMRYRAPAARNGAIISACAVLLLCGLALYDRRATKRRPLT
jgi:hypothetical protein